MSRKLTLIIVTAAVFILILGLVVLFLLLKRDTGEQSGAETSFFGSLTDLFSERVIPGDGSNNQSTGEDADETPIPRLRQVTDKPVAGAFISDTRIRYVDRESGHIFETAVDARGVRRISNTTIPGVHRAFFADEGNRVILQLLAEDSRVVKTFSGEIAAEASATSSNEEGLEGVFLPEHIEELAVSETDDTLFYLRDEGGKVLGLRTTLAGEETREVFENPIREWIPQWIDERRVALTTKTSAGLGGILYFLNTTTGRVQKILSGIPGLSSLTNPDGTLIFIGSSDREDFQSQVYNVSDRSRTIAPFHTLPEKCVWSAKSVQVLYCAVPNPSPLGNSPDDWYRGEISFSDDLWRIDLESEESEFLISTYGERGVESGQLGSFERDHTDGADATNLKVNSEETHIIFTNKKDGTLWVLRLEE